MREFEVAGKTVRLNERDYKQLLRRFDTTRVVRGGYFCSIRVPCICSWYSTCITCPFTSAFQVTRTMRACFEVLKKLHLYPKYASITTNFQVGWLGSNNEAAVTEINKIHDALLSLERK